MHLAAGAYGRLPKLGSEACDGRHLPECHSKQKSVIFFKGHGQACFKGTAMFGGFPLPWLLLFYLKQTLAFVCAGSLGYFLTWHPVEEMLGFVWKEA